MQSTWAIGEIIAACVVGVVLPRYGWRAVFFVGILPALLVLWIRKRRARVGRLAREGRSGGGSLRVLLRPDIRRNGLLATAMNASGCSGTGGSSRGSRRYLTLPVEQGGRGLDLLQTTTWLVVMGSASGSATCCFGFAADAFGTAAQLCRVPADRLRAGAAVRPGDPAHHALCCSAPSSRSSAPGSSRASAR